MSARFDWDWNGVVGTLTVVKQEIWIGRDPTCQICVASPQLAPRHCRVVRAGGEYFVETEGAAQTRVNGAQIARQRLRDGDRIECGGVTLRFAEQPAGGRPRAEPPAPAPPPTPAPAPAPPPPAPAPPAPALAQLHARVAELERDVQARDTDAVKLRAQLEQRTHDLHRATDELRDAQYQLDGARRENEALAEQLGARTAALAERDRLLAQRNAELDTCEQQLRQLRAEAEQHDRDADRLAARTRELGAGAADAHRELERARADHASAQAATAAAQQHAAKVQAELGKVNLLLAELQLRVAGFEAEHKKYRDDDANHRRIIESQQEQLAAERQAHAHLETMYRELQERHHRLDLDHVKALGGVAKLTNENANHGVEQSRLRAEIQRVVAERVTDATARDALVRAERLEADLVDARQAITRLTADTETYQQLREAAKRSP